MEEKKSLKEKIRDKADEAKFRIKVGFDNTWEWIGQHKVELIIVTPIIVKALDTIGRGISASSRNNYAKAKYGNNEYGYRLKYEYDGIKYSYILKRRPSVDELKKFEAMVDSGYDPEETLSYLGLR